MKIQMRRVLIAFQFLTIIPVKIKGDIHEQDILGSTIYFPIVGAFQGIILILLVIILRYVFFTGVPSTRSSEIISISIIIALTLSNKGLHIDGLADTFDALGVTSTGNITSDIEKRLSAMKDSRIGSMGAIGIIFDILIKFVLINALLVSHYPFTMYLTFFLMPAFSRWAMLPAIYKGSSARNDGMGKLFIGHTSSEQLVASTLLLFVITIIAMFICWLTSIKKHDLGIVCYHVIPFVGMSFILLYGFSILSVRFFKNRFNGITGDTLGAISELSEMVFLFLAVLWLNR